jgi:ATP-dependent phosphofructokinase / diphosphate-dependent phosphofructokinase
MAKHIGILTADGDSPGLNAAIRAFGKSAIGHHGYRVTGFLDGFHGLQTNTAMEMSAGDFSGILTVGGTTLGTSRLKIDDLDPLIASLDEHALDGLVCFGGKDTQLLAYRLKQAGVNVITLPKSITNHIPKTDRCIGFDSALTVAAESIDRLHTTAHSHHRIIVVEIMGDDSGWLALGAGIAGGADVILIPEIPYHVDSVADTILERSRKGKRFSLVAVAEGAISEEDHQFFRKAREVNQFLRSGSNDYQEVDSQLMQLEEDFTSKTIDLTQRLNQATQLDTRITILGFLQRGGAPTANDRLLATTLGTSAALLAADDHWGVMVAMQGGQVVPVALEEVVEGEKTVPLDHPWVMSARAVGTNLGD